MEIARVGFSVMIAHEKRLLVGKRIGVSRGDGNIACPGGKLEYGESWEEAVHRELKEETDLQVRMEPADPYRPELWASNEAWDNGHFVTLWLLGRVMPNSPTETVVMEPNKCAWWKWLTLPQLAQQLSAKAMLAWANHQPNHELEWIPLSHFIHYRERIGI
jgi:ADP-ribose pyrophosphatase YjhB (NUDIX family)